MVHTRRSFVAGVSAAAVVGGGCLETTSDDRPGDSPGNGNGDDNGNGEGNGNGDGSGTGNGAGDGNETEDGGNGDENAPMESVYALRVERIDDDTDVYEWSLESDDDGGPPYRLEAEPVDEADVFGDDVLDLESLSSEAREEIRTAREEDGRVSFDDSPAILDEGPPQFVRVDDAYYEVLVSVGN